MPFPLRRASFRASPGGRSNAWVIIIDQGAGQYNSAPTISAAMWEKGYAKPEEPTKYGAPKRGLAAAGYPDWCS